MAINIRAPEFQELKPRILVFGVGGAGGNAVNNMVHAGLEGVDFVVANTDAQALTHSRAGRRIHIGGEVTQGLGAGSRPDIGAAAAEESLEEVREALQGVHMVFITAGMGGGTGTGAAPVIAKAARDSGILTVGVVTKPFAFEGQRRMRLAEEGIGRLQNSVDTLIVIPNQNLFRVANEKTTFAKAFQLADDVLYCGVRGITDLMVMPGLINLDFADVRTVMSEMGKAMMGTGEADGEKKAIRAAEAAISNPLLDHTSMKGARGVLINITGGLDLTLFEVDEAANKIRAEVDPDANIIVGSTFDEGMEGRMRVSVVATGIDVDGLRAQKPVSEQNRITVSGPAPEALRHSVQPDDRTKAAQALPASPPAVQRHPVHDLQREIAHSGLATEGQAQSVAPAVSAPSIQPRVASANGSARTTTGSEQSRAQPGSGIISSPAYQPQIAHEQAGTSRSADMSGGRTLATAHSAPLDLSRFAEPLTPEEALRRTKAGEADATQRKKTAFSFFNEIGSSLGLSQPQQRRSDLQKEEPGAPRRLTFGSPEGGAQLASGKNATGQTARSNPESRVSQVAATPASTRPAGVRGQSDSGSTKPSDDELEIPAFLRRQAN